MLVLSRKIGQTICLDGNIEVVVTAICGNRVSLGISAPKSVGIRRSELATDRPGVYRHDFPIEVN